jgi:hypothetical protein
MMPAFLYRERGGNGDEENKIHVLKYPIKIIPKLLFSLTSSLLVKKSPLYLLHRATHVTSNQKGAASRLPLPLKIDSTTNYCWISIAAYSPSFLL